MTKSTFAVLLFMLYLSNTLNAQQRIGLDISTRNLNSLMFTFHYQSVFSGNWLYGIGFFSGSNGRDIIQNNPERLYSGTPIQSPFQNVNRPIQDSVTTYSILDYSLQVRSIGLQIGLGYFFEFGSTHGLRINLNSRLGLAQTRTVGYYRSIETLKETKAPYVNYHWVSSIGLEITHTIRLTGRFTFNYGVKLPYYLILDKRSFNPTDHKDLVYGFEPELSIGITRMIGKCN